MSELWMTAVLGFSGVAFAIGGMHGGRVLRRYLLPLGLALALLLNAFPLWRVATYAVALSFALHLGYGDKASWWKKALVFALYAIPSLVFGLTIWQVFSPVIMLLIMFISQTKTFADDFKWKLVEFNIGVLIACTLLGAIK